MTVLLLCSLILQGNGSVTIEGRDLQLDYVFAQLSKQSGELFDVDASLQTSRVHLNIKGLQLFEAVHQVCRTQGNARLVAPTYGGPFLIVPGLASQAPTTSDSALWARLTGIRSLRSTDFQVRATELAVDLQLLWTKQCAPAALQLHLIDALDETNASLLRDSPSSLVRTLGKPAQVYTCTLTLNHPALTAHKLARLSLDVDLWRPEVSVPISLSGLSVGNEAPFEGGHVTLTRSSRAGTTWTGVLDIRIPPFTDRAPLAGADRLRSITLHGKDGKSYAASVITSLVRSDKLAAEIAAQDLPKETELTGIQAIWIVQYQKSTAHLRFKDIDLP